MNASSPDSSAPDFDMSSAAIQARLETLGQLYKLANYLSKGTILGRADELFNGSVTEVGRTNESQVAYAASKDSNRVNE